MSLSTFTPRQLSALKVYAQDMETAASPFASPSRLAAQDALEGAQAVLTGRQVALLKIMLVGRRTVTDVARSSRQPVAELEVLFVAASTALADHYERRAQA